MRQIKLQILHISKRESVYHVNDVIFVRVLVVHNVCNFQYPVTFFFMHDQAKWTTINNWNKKKLSETHTVREESNVTLFTVLWMESNVEGKFSGKNVTKVEDTGRSHRDTNKEMKYVTLYFILPLVCFPIIQYDQFCLCRISSLHIHFYLIHAPSCLAKGL